MKIAHIVCVYPPYRGGIGNVAYNYQIQLNNLGLDSSVYTPKYKNLKKEEENNKVFYIEPLLSLGNGAFLPQIFLELKKYEIVHLHYPFFGTAEIVWLQKLLPFTDFKLVLHYHMDTIQLSPITKLLSIPSKIIENSLFHQASAITCASFDYIKSSSISNLFIKYRSKFHEIPFGVDEKVFRPRIGPQKKNNRLFFIANLDKAHYFKGLPVLLNAFAVLENKDLELFIGGEGDEKQSYIDLAHKLQLGGRVKFLGKLTQEELVRNYQEATVTVLPSINAHEAFGLVLIESMACGTPVIASDLPGVRDVFRDGKEGLKFKTNDQVDLAKKIDNMFRSQNAREMGEQGIRLVQKKYTWSRSATKLVEIYKTILQ